MAAIPINLICEKGTDFSATFNIQNEANTTPLNLTGYTAVAKLRRSYIRHLLQLTLLLVIQIDTMVLYQFR